VALQVGLEDRLEVAEVALDHLGVVVVEEQGQHQAKVVEVELLRKEEAVAEEVHHPPPPPSSPRRPRGDQRSRYHR